MTNHNEHLHDSNKTIITMFVIFLTIVLSDAISGNLSLAWSSFMGVMIIGFSLSVIFLSPKDHENVPHDHGDFKHTE